FSTYPTNTRLYAGILTWKVLFSATFALSATLARAPATAWLCAGAPKATACHALSCFLSVTDDRTAPPVVTGYTTNPVGRSRLIGSVLGCQDRRSSSPTMKSLNGAAS